MGIGGSISGFGYFSLTLPNPVFLVQIFLRDIWGKIGGGEGGGD